MKKFRLALLFIFLIPCLFLFGACSQQSKIVFVTNIEQTSTVGSTTTYTITFSNGKKSLLTVENGKNGEDLTLESIKEYCTANGLIFEDFLAQYLSFTYENSDLKTATNKALQSAVSVYSVFNTPYQYSIGCGAGVIYKMDDTVSYIITNYHVVYYNESLSSNNIAQDIRLFQYGTDRYIKTTDGFHNGYYSSYSFGEDAVKCEYIGGSMTYDIAILKVKTSDLTKNNPNACAVEVSDNYSVMDQAIAIGNPEGDGIAVTSGVVSVESESLYMKGADEATYIDFRVMRIDTAVNGGNSGGGLFNQHGKLIGIVNAKIVDYEIDNIAYALPIDNVTKVADNIIYYNSKTNSASPVKKVYLGIDYDIVNCHEVYNPSTHEIKLYDDLKITAVSPTSPAYEYLLVGDIITSCLIERVDGSEEPYDFRRAYQFADILLTLREGDKILIKGERKNTETSLCTITITSSLLSDPDLRL